MPKLEQGIEHHKAGRLQQAEAVYRSILAQTPDHADALHWLGVVTLQQGQAQAAADLIARAIKRRPDYAEALNNLGLALQAQERWAEAVESFTQASALAPKDADIQLNLGLTLRRQGELSAAVAAFERALALDPNDAHARNYVGLTLLAQGSPREAIDAFRRAVESAPGFAEAHYNLSNALYKAGRTADAVAAQRQLVTLQPASVPARLTLGRMLHKQGALGEAVAAYREALALKPDLAQVHTGLGDALAALGDIEAAVDAFRTALELDTDNSNARRGLVAAFHSLTPTHYQPALDQDLEACFAAPTIDPQDLAALTARQLVYKHRINERWDTERETALSQLGADTLLHTLLRRCVNVDAGLERALTALRRDRLLTYHESAGLPSGQIALIVALGLQGFHNEYVFNESAEETAAIEALAMRCGALAERARQPSAALEALLLLLAMYRPLYALGCAPTLEAIALEAWSEPVRALVARTLIEPREEEAIAPGLTSLGEAEDATSRAVRAQYEEHPYPRWLALLRLDKIDLAEQLHRAFPHFRPPAFLNGPTRVLVAGCGTGREPLSLALAYADVEIVALDLSRRSLAYAVRRARALGVENVRFVHGDLLALPRLQERFHVIQCAGVLHHMAEPLRGWRVLTELLLPGGLMKIGLYSERARALEATAQAEIHQRGLRPITKDIKAFRTSILYGDARATLGELGEGEDLYTMSACRDLLFHAQERRFSLPQIRQALDTLGLSFLGFELSVPQIAPRYRALSPDDPHMTDLTAWERFESRHPQAFAGMYVFWCQKKQ